MLVWSLFINNIVNVFRNCLNKFTILVVPLDVKLQGLLYEF